MKLGVVGKGGTGKTTIAALVARTYVARGRRVLAIDTDSDPNLALALGVGIAEAERLPVLPRELVVGTGGGAVSPSDLLAGYGLATASGVMLLEASAVTEAGAGCACSAHASVRSLLAATIEQEAEVTVIDMEAGLEHLSRSGGTLAYSDVLLVVLEPSLKSVLAGRHACDLAEQLGIPHVYAVGNKASLPDDADFFATASDSYGLPLAAVVPFDPQLAEADRSGAELAAAPGSAVADVVGQLVELLDSLDERSGLRWKIGQIDRRLTELQEGLR